MIRAALQAVKRGVCVANDRVAVASYLLHGRRPRPGLIILCFHRVAQGLPRFAPFNPYCVSLATFAAQVTTLAGLRGIRVIDGRETAHLVEGGTPAPGAYVLLTFDDGYRNTIRAAEVLQRHGFGATFFVSTEHLGREVFEFSPFDRWVSGRPGVDPAWYRPLSLDDCRALIELGMEIQSHGHTHRALGRLPAEEVLGEIRASATVIEGTLGQKMFALAYPYGGRRLGDFHEGTEGVLRAANLGFAVSTEAGVNGLDTLGQERYRLRRIPINDDDRGLVFEAKAAGYTGCLDGLKAVWHRLLALGRR